MIDLNRLIQRFWRRFAAPPTIAPAPRLEDTLLRLPATHKEAAARLVDPLVVSTITYKNRLLKADRTGSDPVLLDFSLALLRELQKRNMPFFPHTYVRTNAEQEKLYANGVTKARAGQSPHNHGMAVDIVHFGRYWDLTKKEWDVIGLIGKEVARKRKIKITWGGDWKFYDPAHWELADWKDRLK